MYCFFSFTKSIWTHGLVVNLSCSEPEAGDVGSIPAGCWNSLLPLCHFAWHWASQCTNTRLNIPMPVRPCGVSGISACHFWNCLSFDEIWSFLVKLVTFKYGLAVESETHKTPAAGMLILFESFLWILLLYPRFFFDHIVAQDRPSIWHFENSSPLLWNPKYFEKGDLPEHFSTTFTFVMPFSHESEHTKLMSSLIIKD